MSETRIVGRRELLWFLSLLHLTRILFTTIGGFVADWANAGYILPLLSGLVYIGVFLLTVRISGGETDLLHSAGASFGRAGKVAVGSIAVVILIARCACMMRVYADVISSIALPDSMSAIIILILTASAVMGAYFGVGAIVTYSYVAGIVFVSTLALILTLNLPDYDILNIFPVLGKANWELTPVLRGGEMFSDLFLVYLVSPYLKDGVSVRRAGVISIVVSAIVTAVTTLCYIMTVEYPLSATFTLPVLEIAFDVNLDIILQRAEGLFFFLWIFSGFISLGAYLAFASSVFARALSLSDRRGIIGIIAFIPFVIAISMKGVADSGEAYKQIFSVLGWASVVLPIVVFLCRRKMRWYDK